MPTVVNAVVCASGIIDARNWKKNNGNGKKD
jgi:hypothetical protein